jgi:hypothetical protein
MTALTGIMAIFTGLSVWSFRNTLKRRRRAALFSELGGSEVSTVAERE